MDHRLTWEEIQEKYPEQWVRLEDVKTVNDDNITVESAVVAKHGEMTTQDLIDGANGLCYPIFVEGRRTFHVGALATA